mgnify:CR=1 FL=1
MSANQKPFEFEICGQKLEATRKEASGKRPSWRYPDPGESSAGVDIEPLAKELPDVITINEEEFAFGPVPKKGPPGFRPLHKTREVKVETVLDGHDIAVHCRVTVRRNHKWYLWLRAEPVRGSGSRSPSATRPGRSPDKESLEKKWLSG